MTWRVSCPKCPFEATTNTLEEVFEIERTHQRSERLSHVVEFERLALEPVGTTEDDD